MIARLLRTLAERRARRRLAELVAQTRASHDIEQYRRRRAAAFKSSRPITEAGRAGR